MTQSTSLVGKTAERPGAELASLMLRKVVVSFFPSGDMELLMSAHDSYAGGKKILSSTGWEQTH